MSDIDEQLRTAEGKGVAELQSASTLEELDAARTAHLGKRSPLSLVQRQLGGMDADERRAVGAAVNEVRARLTEVEAARRAILTDERDRVVLAAEAIDVTLPPRVPSRGTLHPVQETMEAMLDILVGLGYRVAEGPQVETEWFNFDALNTPPDHPARSLQDTIYVRPPGADHEGPDESTGLLLRTHTSPMQIRTMLADEPPLYVAIPGRVYRADTMDATHLPMFHQMEGLAVDADLSFADLKGSLTVAARALLGEDVALRFRPHFFPFTEPSCELDAWFDPDGGAAPGTPGPDGGAAPGTPGPDGGSALGTRGGRWMELLGAGMVHPNVLRAAGLDPEMHRGFAWGMGVDRMAMLRHGISDLRLLVENDLRFLSSL